MAQVAGQDRVAPDEGGCGDGEVGEAGVVPLPSCVVREGADALGGRNVNGENAGGVEVQDRVEPVREAPGLGVGTGAAASCHAVLDLGDGDDGQVEGRAVALHPVPEIGFGESLGGGGGGEDVGVDEIHGLRGRYRGGFRGAPASLAGPSGLP